MRIHPTISVLVLAGILHSAPSARDTAQLGQPAGTYATVLAVDLHQLYRQNEIDADNHVKGKALNIKGVIATISKDAFGSPYLTLKTTGLLGLRANFGRDQMAELATLRVGQKVTIRGTVEGFAMDCVSVKECVLVK